MTLEEVVSELLDRWEEIFTYETLDYFEELYEIAVDVLCGGTGNNSTFGEVCNDQLEQAKEKFMDEGFKQITEQYFDELEDHVQKGVDMAADELFDWTSGFLKEINDSSKKLTLTLFGAMAVVTSLMF